MISDNSNLYNKKLSQQEYQYYRDSLASVYLDKDSEIVLHSSFSVREGNVLECDHYLAQINGAQSMVLQCATFDYDETFKKQMLEPCIVDFAQRNPIMTTDIQSSMETANYVAFSETNNVLSVSNIEPEYAYTIARAVQQIEPTIFEQHLVQQQAMQQQKGGIQKVLRMDGFTNTLGIVTVMIAGIGLFVVFTIIMFNI